LFDNLYKSTLANNNRVYSKEFANNLKNIDKYTMIKYPIMSRPVLTEQVYDEYNAIITRLYNV